MVLLRCLQGSRTCVKSRTLELPRAILLEGRPGGDALADEGVVGAWVYWIVPGIFDVDWIAIGSEAFQVDGDPSPALPSEDDLKMRMWSRKSSGEFVSKSMPNCGGATGILELGIDAAG